MTPEQLAEIETRAQGCLPHLHTGSQRGKSMARILCMADIPALIAEIKRLRAAIGDIREAVRLSNAADSDLRSGDFPTRWCAANRVQEMISRILSLAEAAEGTP